MAKTWRGVPTLPEPRIKAPPDEPASDPVPTIAILNRPLPLIGYNLAGRVQIGTAREPGPMETIQERTMWVKSLVPEAGWLHVVTWSDKHLWLSPGTVAWLE